MAYPQRERKDELHALLKSVLSADNGWSEDPEIILWLLVDEAKEMAAICLLAAYRAHARQFAG